MIIFEKIVFQKITCGAIPIIINNIAGCLTLNECNKSILKFRLRLSRGAGLQAVANELVRLHKNSSPDERVQ